MSTQPSVQSQFRRKMFRQRMLWKYQNSNNVKTTTYFKKDIIFVNTTISPPDTKQRFAILKNLLSKFDTAIQFKGKRKDADNDDYTSPSNNEQLMKFAELCVGYVASDLAALVQKAMFLGMT